MPKPPDAIAPGGIDKNCLDELLSNQTGQAVLGFACMLAEFAADEVIESIPYPNRLSEGFLDVLRLTVLQETFRIVDSSLNAVPQNPLVARVLHLTTLERSIIFERRAGLFPPEGSPGERELADLIRQLRQQLISKG